MKVKVLREVPVARIDGNSCTFSPKLAKDFEVQSPSQSFGYRTLKLCLDQKVHLCILNLEVIRKQLSPIIHFVKIHSLSRLSQVPDVQPKFCVFFVHSTFIPYKSPIVAKLPAAQYQLHEPY